MPTADTFFVLSLLTSLGVSAMAAGPDAVVLQRQADMKSMSAAAKSLSEFFSGRKPYDTGVFRTQARSIAEMAGQRLVGHFYSVTAADGSQASEVIKAEREKFELLAHELKSYAAQVDAAAKDGGSMPETMRMRPAEAIEGGPFARKRQGQPDVTSYSAEHAFHMMLQTCTICHAEFRLKR